MGNCQAAEAATVVIQHPSGRVERVYWSLSASQVMAANPGHYVAVIITSTSNSSDSRNSSSSNAPVKHLKLLRPDDTLHIGHVYRLVSFEEVLREFASRRHVRPSRLLVKQKHKPSSKKAAAAASSGQGGGGPATEPESSPATVVESPATAEVEFEELEQRLASNRRTSSGAAARHGQWRPALQSIAEIGG
ncbi:uncharacterized protein LOC103721611 isoform X2 [Phoenix dactylifera]|uniref:Uncharacterized protein LOC103721611 isoform X2 n=1 Tax=Phoenix dactylifera TaxID=42345 RepID=A0A8B7D0D5_PHODC|nr:uncharacterized protein LOC103721611 isoform X2 [Phoenix dactylifera]